MKTSNSSKIPVTENKKLCYSIAKLDGCHPYKKNKSKETTSTTGCCKMSLSFTLMYRGKIIK